MRLPEVRARAVFLDRDGVLCDLVYYPSSGEYESPRVVEDLRVRAGAPALLATLRELGWRLFLVSNQPSHAKGKTSMDSLRAVHARFETVLAEGGARLDEAFYCFHHPEAVVTDLRGRCPCRKPSPHFLLEAARRWDIDLAASWMVGDQDIDIACGRAAGCRTVLIPDPASASKAGLERPDALCENLGQIPSILDAPPPIVEP